VFALWQDTRQQRIEDQRAQQAQKIENQRAEAERELGVQRAQDEALQAYLNQMSHLLLEKNLRESKEDSEVRTLARARTLTVLGRLDTSRKEEVMQFLVEADLVRDVDGRDPIIGLSGADLSNVKGLDQANLEGAKLNEANLSDADLSFANLRDAYLSNAYTDLSNANLYGADLRDTNLSDANLNSANLTYASLAYAKGITNEELEQQAKSLERATMPNGQKYEDWLKDKKAREEGG
jgi:uncharacterized protein YjbI with pentapeptide repeats